MTKRFSDITPSAERVVDAAEGLVQQFGFNGFSYDDIARAIDIRKPSIHHHFRTKAELVQVIVQRYAHRFGQALAALEAAEADPVARLLGYGELFAATYRQDRRLCLCGILGAEAASISAEVAAEVEEFFQLNLDWVAAQLRAGVACGKLRAVAASADQAYGLLSALEGAMMVGRGMRSDNSPATAGKTYLSNLLN
jgi:TetR/AcrR family transcriptional regulator, transcriptional repressor for nem operon